MSPRNLEDWIEPARKVARFVSFDYPDVEQDDIQQELLLFVAENSTTLRDPDQVGAVQALEKRAKLYCREQRREHLSLTAQYSYRTSDVRRILETAFDYQDWENAFVPEDAKSDLHKSSDAVELTADIRWAMAYLPEQYQNAIYSAFREHDYPDGRTNSRKQLNRAVSALVDVLNWYHRGKPDEGIGTRKIVSNARAMGLLNRDYGTQ